MQNLQSCSRKTGVCLQILGMFAALQALEILHSWLGNAQVATPKNVFSHVFCVSYLPEGFNSRDPFITVSRSHAARPPKLWSAVPLFPGTRIGTHFSRKRWHLDDCCFRKTSCESDPFKDDAAQRVSVCFSPGTFNVSCMLDSCWECCSWQHCNQQDLQQSKSRSLDELSQSSVHGSYLKAFTPNHLEVPMLPMLPICF
jgi:hypothetical protein